MVAVLLPPLGQIPPLDVWEALGLLAVAATPVAIWVTNTVRRLRLEALELRAERDQARTEVAHLTATLAATREAAVLARENQRIGQSADLIAAVLHAELATMRQEVSRELRQMAAEPATPHRALNSGEGRTPTPY